MISVKIRIGMLSSKFVVLFMAFGMFDESRQYHLNRDFDESKIMKGADAEWGPYVSHVLAVWKRGENFYTCMSNALTPVHSVTTCHCVLSVHSSPDRLWGLDPEHHDLDNRFLVWSHHFNKSPAELEKEGETTKQLQIRKVKWGTPYFECKTRGWIWQNDIGILTVSKPFREDKYFATFAIFSERRKFTEDKYREFLNRNYTCQSYGWGTLRQLFKEGINATRVLQSVEQVVVDWDVCMKFCIGLWTNLCADRQIAPNVTKKNKICTYRSNQRVGGPCYGDSGSLLMCQEEDPGNLYGIAILAGGLHCGQFNGGPFFYYKLTPFWNFLQVFDPRLKLYGGGNPVDPTAFTLNPSTDDVPDEPVPKLTTSAAEIGPCQMVIIPPSRYIYRCPTGRPDSKSCASKMTRHLYRLMIGLLLWSVTLVKNMAESSAHLDFNF